jgi:hypothetical protein
MKIIPFIIEAFAKQVLGKNGGVYFEGFKRVVLIAEDTNLKGEAKWNLALAEFKKIGYSLTEFAINTGLTLAVLWLNSTLKQIKIEK